MACTELFGVCEITCGCSIPFKSIDPCSTPTAGAAVDAVEIKIYKTSDHSLVGTYTTDSLGDLDVSDLTVGTEYDAVSYKSGKGQGVTRFTAACGALVSVPVASYRRSITTSGCIGPSARALAGSTIVVTKSPSFWVTGVTDGSGAFYFSPSSTGTYSYTATPASSKFAPFSGTFSIASLCTTGASASVTFAAAAGHKCCNNSTGGGHDTPYPIKFPLTVTLNTGQTFDINDCSGSSCVSITVPTCGGPKKVISCPGSCDYDFWPDDLGGGTTPMFISVTMTSAGVSMRVASNTDYVQYSPTRDCTNSCFGASDYRFQAWYLKGGDCPTGGGDLNSSMTIESIEPFAATCYWTSGGLDNGVWDVDPIGPARIILSATVVAAG